MSGPVRALLGLLLATSSLAACGRDLPVSDLREGTVGGLGIRPGRLELSPGQAFAIDVFERTATGTVSALGRSGLSLELTTPDVVRLESDGRGAALAVGETAIVARLGDRVARAEVTVVGAPLIGLELRPDPALLAVGESLLLEVDAVRADGLRLGVAGAANGTTYATDTPAVVSVDADGRLRGLAEGNARVTARHAGFEATISVRVGAIAGDFVALRFEPDRLELLTGNRERVRLIATRRDGSELDAFGARLPVRLGASEPNVARIEPDGVVVSGQQRGRSLITASLDRLAAVLTVDVQNGAELVSISVDPEFLQLPRGTAGQLRVLGRYSDGSVTDLTAASRGTRYTVLDPSVAAVSPDGLVQGLDFGFTPIRVTSGGLVAEVGVEVTRESVPVELRVEPDPVSVGVNGVAQLRVIAFFADGAILDVTPTAAGTRYQVVDPGLAVVDANGQVAGRREGSGAIVVSYGPLTARVGLRVSAVTPRVVGLRIEPSPIEVDVGDVALFEVFAEYDDGTVRIVSMDPQLRLAVADPGVARLLSPSELLGSGPGRTTLVAELDGVRSSADVVVGPVMGRYVRIFIVGAGFLSVGDSAGWTVIGQTAAGDFEDLGGDPRLAFRVVDPSILDVQPGLMTGLRAGTTRIEAVFDGMGATHDVLVTAGPERVVDLFWRPSSLNLAVGGRAVVRLWGRLSSGAEVDVTYSLNVMYNWTGPIDALPDASGIIIVARAAGRAEFFAELDGLSATLPVTITGTSDPIVRIEVSTRSPLAVGASAPVQVRGFTASGMVVDLSRDPGVGIDVTPTRVAQLVMGQVLGVSPGSATLTARYQNLSASFTVTVIGTSDPVVRIEIATPSTLAVGAVNPFAVWGLTAGGIRVPLTGDPSLQIALSPPGRARLSPRGLEGLAAGDLTITASYQGLTATARVIVTAGSGFVRLEFQPAFVDLGVMEVRPVRLLGFDANGAATDLSTSSMVQFTVPPFVALQPSPAGTLDVIGLAPGGDAIVARLGNLEADLRVNVRNPMVTLVDIRFEPGDFRLAPGATASFIVIGRYSDGSESPVRSFSVRVFDPRIAGVNNNGIVEARSVGRTTIEASSGGFRATANVVVEAASLVGIEVQPPVVQLDPGDTQSLRVIGRYSDGSQRTETGAMFASRNAMVATVSAAGLVTAVAQGSTNVDVRLGGFAANAAVIVGPPVLVGLVIDPATASLAVGATVQLRAIALLQGGGQVEVPAQFVMWSSAAAGTARVDANGLVTAVAVGSTVITANVMGVTAQATVTVTGTGPGRLIGLRLEPSVLTLEIARNQELVLIGIFDNGAEIPLSGATWTSSAPMVASVSVTGRVTAFAVGQTTITAEVRGLRTTAQITVVAGPPQLVRVEFTPRTLRLGVGETASFTVEGVYSDGSRRPVMGTVSSLDPMIAAVDAAGSSVLGVAVGRTELEFVGPLTARATVIVTAAAAPTLSQLDPAAIRVGSMAQPLRFTGTGLAAGQELLIDGQVMTTRILSATEGVALVPATLLSRAAERQVVLRGATGTSNTLVLLVTDRPVISSQVPVASVASTTVSIALTGSGLLGTSLQAGPFVVLGYTVSGDGSRATVQLRIPNLMPGTYTLTLSNPFGAASFPLQILQAATQDLVVASGETRRLSGTQVFQNVLVNTGGRIVGEGTEPLVLFATGDMTIRGAIVVSGASGGPGFTDPAAGGAGGPGGGGGGAAGDGDTRSPASGGPGAPAGEDGVRGVGAGTPAGDGGGRGAGSGGSGGCGQAGGGGALGGAGGAGGGDLGVGRGGAGGDLPAGSTFDAGTGGGGGSTCGSNSGGGGGGGGGMLVLQVAAGGTLIVDGTLSADGGHGGAAFSGTGGGGGGSGGRVELRAPGGRIVVNDTISAVGGNGGDSDFGDTGGGGGGGLIIIDAAPGGSISAGLGLFRVDGGAPGASLGQGNVGLVGASGQVEQRQ